MAGPAVSIIADLMSTRELYPGVGDDALITVVATGAVDVAAHAKLS